jgi:hypothetical protein
MGGGGFVGNALPVGAAVWCSGDDVVQDLNDLFHQNPSNQQYIDARDASLAAFQTAASTGEWQDLLAAYTKAYDAAGMTLCRGWASYLEALGTLIPTSSNGGNVATTLATAPPGKVLTFGSVPDWMAVGLNVSDSTNPGAINSGQTVEDFDATTVKLTAKVDATVGLGDTIVFALPTGLGPSNIQAIAQARHDGLTASKKMKTFKHSPHDSHSTGHRVQVTQGAEVTISSPYIAPIHLLRRHRTIRHRLLRYLQSTS